MPWSGFIENKLPAGPPYYGYDPVSFRSMTVDGNDYCTMDSGGGLVRRAPDVHVVDCGNGKVKLVRDDGKVACEEGHWFVFREEGPGQNWEIMLYWNQNYGSLGGKWTYVDGEGFLNMKKDGRALSFADAGLHRHHDW